MFGGLEQILGLKPDFIGFLLKAGDEQLRVSVSGAQDRLGKYELKVNYRDIEGYVPLSAAVFEIEGERYTLSNIANTTTGLDSGKIFLRLVGGEGYNQIRISELYEANLKRPILEKHYKKLHPYRAMLTDFERHLYHTVHAFYEKTKEAYHNLSGMLNRLIRDKSQS